MESTNDFSKDLQIKTLQEENEKLKQSLNEVS